MPKSSKLICVERQLTWCKLSTNRVPSTERMVQVAIPAFDMVGGEAHVAVAKFKFPFWWRIGAHTASYSNEFTHWREMAPLPRQIKL